MAGFQDRLLNVADLAERWGCSEGSVLDRVRNDGLRFVAIGSAVPRPNTKGQKGYRFRVSDVEAWDWDGVVRLGKCKRRPPKRKSPG